MLTHVIRHFAIGLLLGTLAAMPAGARADDTEIYLGSETLSEGVRPNVLFILDTSGSMSSTVSGTGKSRLQNMQDALVDLLDELNNVNVGMMRFTDPGGPVLFPVAYIDDDAEEVTSAGQADISVRVAESADDAEELGGAMLLDSLALDILDTASFGPEASLTLQVSDDDDDAEQSSLFMNNNSSQMELTDNASGNRTTAVRFRNVTIPQGAEIQHAELDFRSRSHRSGTTNLTVHGHDVDNSPDYPNGPGGGDIYRRVGVTGPDQRTAASVDWSAVPEWFNGERYQSPELAPVIQEIVDRAGWASGNALSLFVSGTAGSLRDSSTYDDSPSRAAILRVDYASGAAGGTQKVAMRFQDVRIPQGVTITGASIEFTASGTNSEPMRVRIRAQAADDAPGFSTATNDISGRPLTTAAVDWTAPAWTVKDEAYQTADLSAVVQAVVDRSGWCGGNDLVLVFETVGGDNGPRRAYSADGDAGLAPVLRVDYDADTPLGPTEGCVVADAQSQVSASKDDAEQIGNSLYLTSNTIEMTTNGSGTRTNGLRFQDVRVPAGAQVLSASITFTSRDNDSGGTSLTFRGHATDDAAQFSSGTGSDVTSRPLTSASVTWNPVPSWSSGEQYTTPDLAAVVGEIVDRSGWASGNDMAFIVSGSGLREVASFDFSPGAAATLRVTYRGTLAQATAGTLTTVRQRLKEIVTDFTPEGYTPIVDTLYEAALYFRGEEVNWGRTRGTGSLANRRSTRVSHPASYTGGSVFRDEGCTDANLSASECVSERIDDSPVYISPMTESCQANYVVLLTDGEANHNNSYLPISSKIGKWPCDVTFSNGGSVALGEFCGTDLVDWLHTTDQSATLAGDNFINTYTIGFNFSGQFLKDLASSGGGGFYTANTASELSGVFKSIFADILSRTTSFATPSLSVNAFNKLFHRNEVYFSLFKPSAAVRWSGNVKKYQLCSDEATGCTLGEVMDARTPPDGPVPAIGADRRLKPEALSFWSATVDGDQILAGGAGAEIPLPADRRVFTYTGAGSPSNVLLETSTHEVVDGNANLSVELLGGSTDPASPLYMPASERTDLIAWMRGQDVDDDNLNGNTTELRYSFTDPLHSSPIAVTYGGTAAAPVIKLFVGTNDGGIRMINAASGIEEWVFYPQEVLDRQRALRANASGDHVYGIDGTPTAWVNDENNDGVVDPSLDANGDGVYEFVRLFIGMRRGGDTLYALDVTPTTATGALTDPEAIDEVSPTLLWTITANSDFPRLGQTWSRPKLARLQFGTATPGQSYARDVLVFAGGYDESQDGTFGSGGQGNAVYIADPMSGARLFYVSGDGAAAHGVGAGVQVAGMNFPIPSDVAILDSNGDGSSDRLYVGDTGGQMWRIDLHAELDTDTGIRSVVGKLAQVSEGASLVDQRKFFYPPDVVQVRDITYSSVYEYDLVTAVTGNRANPLNQVVEDRFFAFRDYAVAPMVDGDPLSEADDDGLADGYSTLQGRIEGAPPAVSAVAGDLYDITDKNDPEGTDLTDLRDADGYYLNFEAPGEKGLAPPVVLAGKVFFTSYLPEGVVSDTACAIAEGAGTLYGLNVLNGAAAFNWDGVGDDNALTKSDRAFRLGGGIPSGAVPIFQEEGITLLIGGGGGATTVDPLIELPRIRTFWNDQSEH